MQTKTMPSKDFEQLVRDVTNYAKKELSSQHGDQSAILCACLIEALSIECADMICDDSENIQKLLMIEEDFDLFSHAKNRVNEEVLASVLQVVNEEEGRLAAAKRIYSNE